MIKYKIKLKTASLMEQLLLWRDSISLQYIICIKFRGYVDQKERFIIFFCAVLQTAEKLLTNKINSFYISCLYIWNINIW